MPFILRLIPATLCSMSLNLLSVTWFCALVIDQILKCGPFTPKRQMDVSLQGQILGGQNDWKSPAYVTGMPTYGILIKYYEVKKNLVQNNIYSMHLDNMNWKNT